MGAGCSLSEVQSLLEKMVPRFPEEKTELFRALVQQLGNLGSQQIRNVAVRPFPPPSLLRAVFYQ